jgi:hypothetical protein
VFPAAKGFPADFWVTIATVIPVLFIALAVQGSTYEALANTGLRYLRSYLNGARGRQRRTAYIVSAFLLAAVAALVVFPVWAEILSILTLGSETDTLGERNFAISATVLLLLVVALPPLVNPYRAAFKIFRDALTSARSRQQSKVPPEQAPDEPPASQSEVSQQGTTGENARPGSSS